MDINLEHACSSVQRIDLLIRHQVYNIKQAKRDIDAVYSMGLFDDVNILPSPSEDSNMENPKVRQRWLVPCAHQSLLFCGCPKGHYYLIVPAAQVLPPAGNMPFRQCNAATATTHAQHATRQRPAPSPDT